MNFNTTYQQPDCQSFDIQYFSALNLDIFILTLQNGHYGCHLKSELCEKPWSFESFRLYNLKQRKNTLKVGEGLYYAMQNKHRHSIRTFFDQLTQFCHLNQLLTNESIDVETIQDLKCIVFAKRQSDEVSGLLIACKEGNIKIVRCFVTCLQEFGRKYPACKKHFADILFYIHFKYRSILHISLMCDYFDILYDLFSWPEKLDLNAGNPYLKALFESIQPNQASVFQIAKDFTENTRIMAYLHQFQITWVLSAIKTLSELNDYFKIHNTLSFALQHGYTDSVRLLLTHISTYIDSSSAALSKNEINALENILLAKHHDIPGFMLSCKNGHIETVKVILQYIQKLSKREELRENLLTILCYTHCDQDTILQICVDENHTEILEAILNWLEPLDLNAAEIIMIDDWFNHLKSPYQDASIFNYEKNKADIEAF
ncbi:MAG: ankyrin repeat domain-containing protein [Endozoicomonadaceae bacterium]|nr:ankyrin repeat domain-containing protein [Endozoicomonadaceae bacterium]